MLLPLLLEEEEEDGAPPLLLAVVVVADASPSSTIPTPSATAATSAARTRATVSGKLTGNPPSPTSRCEAKVWATRACASCNSDRLLQVVVVVVVPPVVVVVRPGRVEIAKILGQRLVLVRGHEPLQFRHGQRKGFGDLGAAAQLGQIGNFEQIADFEETVFLRIGAVLLACSLVLQCCWPLPRPA